MEWTEERIETLRRLSLEGMSARQIAEQLGGVSRNAVIGKLNRLDREAKAPSQPKPVTAQVGRIRDAAPAPRPRPAQPSVEPRAPIRCEEARGMATFLTLEAHMCRWPIGDPCGADFTFCGRPADGRTYCDSHARQAYRPAAANQDMARQLRRVLAS